MTNISRKNWVTFIFLKLLKASIALVVKSNVTGVDFFQIDEDVFRNVTTIFLYSPRGMKYKPIFDFAYEPSCGKDCPDIKESMVAHFYSLSIVLLSFCIS